VNSSDSNPAPGRVRLDPAHLRGMAEGRTHGPLRPGVGI
jgi:hypothetical protein